MTLRLVLSTRARTQAYAVDEWWQQNRTAAPDTFWNEFIDVLKLLVDNPNIGVSAPRRRV